jgi:hypothetical protein
MNYLRYLIHRLRAGESERRIARDLRISRITVHRYHELADDRPRANAPEIRRGGDPPHGSMKGSDRYDHVRIALPLLAPLLWLAVGAAITRWPLIAWVLIPTGHISALAIRLGLWEGHVVAGWTMFSLNIILLMWSCFRLRGLWFHLIPGGCILF